MVGCPEHTTSCRIPAVKVEFRQFIAVAEPLLFRPALLDRLWGVISGEPLSTRRFPLHLAQYPGHTGNPIAHRELSSGKSRPQPNRPSSSSPKSGRCWQRTATSATASRPRSCTRTCGWMADPPCSDGGDRGPAIVPGDPDSSPLIQAVRYEKLEMPPAGRLVGGSDRGAGQMG